MIHLVLTPLLQRAKVAPIANSLVFVTGAEVKWVNDGP